MSDLEVVYSKYVTEPVLEESKLVISIDKAWEHTDTECNNVHIVVRFNLENVPPNFLKWMFYARRNGIWEEVEWSDLIEEHKVAVFNGVLAQPKWIPFYEQDVLPPWEDAWLTLAALGQA